MKYIFQKHFSLQTQELFMTKIYSAVIFEPKYELAQLYAKYLSLQNLQVRICLVENDLKTLVLTTQPDMLVYNIDKGYEILKYFKHQNPAIILITIADDLGETELDRLMELGISGHVNRSVTPPRDIGTLAGQLLQY
jgi:DNA-binding NarL/FixJ family response regulator